MLYHNETLGAILTLHSAKHYVNKNFVFFEDNFLHQISVHVFSIHIQDTHHTCQVF
jgi:hypothetical protein